MKKLAYWLERDFFWDGFFHHILLKEEGDNRYIYIQNVYYQDKNGEDPTKVSSHRYINVKNNDKLFPKYSKHDIFNRKYYDDVVKVYVSKELEYMMVKERI